MAPEQNEYQSPESMIGHEVTWDFSAPGRKTQHVVGKVVATQQMLGVTLTNERGTWPAYRFKIKPNDGSRAVWTCAFADERGWPDDA